MKRSEMKKRLLQCLVKEELSYGRVSAIPEVAETILAFIEEQGMVPPIIQEQSWKMLENGELTYAVHEWENEEK